VWDYSKGRPLFPPEKLSNECGEVSESPAASPFVLHEDPHEDHLVPLGWHSVPHLQARHGEAEADEEGVPGDGLVRQFA
jgi:hypothetical protein